MDISCLEFSCPVQDLFVRSSKDGEPVTIEAEACSHPSQPRLRTDEAALFVRWPQLSYPWVRHELRPAGFDDNAGMLDAYTHLARILIRLRGRGYGDIARHRDIVENYATGRTLRGKAMLTYLLSQGVIETKGELFVLNDSRAAELGINWVDLKKRTLNARVRSFLAQFLHQNQQRPAAAL